LTETIQAIKQAIILPDASHFAMLQDPVGYTKAVLDFLGGM
jgi:pimeloyl-ACP methyl ester carboxylesterase